VSQCKHESGNFKFREQNLNLNIITLSQVGYFYGGDCEGYCLLACDSSVEASMIVVEEKLLGEKTVLVYEEGRTE